MQDLPYTGMDEGCLLGVDSILEAMEPQPHEHTLQQQKSNDKEKEKSPKQNNNNDTAQPQTASWKMDKLPDEKLKKQRKLQFHQNPEILAIF